MGSGFAMKCPKCGYKFYRGEGIGFFFPSLYEETVQKAKSGKLGPEIKAFFKEHKNGVINSEIRTFVCEECGDLSSNMPLTMYLPKQIDAPEPDYVMESDLVDNYLEYAKYPHKCKKCGGKMRMIDHEEDLMCPKCRVPLECEDFILWD